MTTELSIKRAPDVVLQKREDVQRLLANLSGISRQRVAARIVIRGLRGATRLRTEMRVNGALLDCGCTVGSAVTALAVLIYALFLWMGGWSVGLLEVLLRGIAIAIVAGLVGKALGIALARIRLARELRALEMVLPD